MFFWLFDARSGGNPCVVNCAKEKISEEGGVYQSVTEDSDVIFYEAKGFLSSLLRYKLQCHQVSIGKHVEMYGIGIVYLCGMCFLIYF